MNTRPAMMKYSGVLPSICTGRVFSYFPSGLKISSVYHLVLFRFPQIRRQFFDTKCENEMRSPARNGTVPSLATAIPSNFCNTSPVLNPHFAEFEIGSNLRNNTPLSPAGNFLRSLQIGVFQFLKVIRAPGIRCISHSVRNLSRSAK